MTDMRTGKEMTRRDFGRGIAAIIAAGVAPSVMAFGRRGLGARAGAWIGATNHYTARDYVQEGLAHMWDGVENAGWDTHDASAVKWADLVGNDHLTMGRGASFADKATLYNGGNIYVDKDLDFSTIDACFLHYFSGTRVVVLMPGQNSLKRGIFYNINATEGAGYYFDGSGIYKSPVIPHAANQTVSVAGVWDYEDSRPASAVFMNGAPVSSASSHRSDWANYSSATSFGGRINLPDYTYASDGLIHSVRLYSRKLTAAEIAHNHAVDRARFFTTASAVNRGGITANA